jgi:hypothetical protein
MSKRRGRNVPQLPADHAGEVPSRRHRNTTKLHEAGSYPHLRRAPTEGQDLRTSRATARRGPLPPRSRPEAQEETAPPPSSLQVGSCEHLIQSGHAEAGFHQSRPESEVGLANGTAPRYDKEDAVHIRTGTVATAVAAAALLVPAVAMAAFPQPKTFAVIPGKSIGGITLRESLTKAKQAWGKPTSCMLNGTRSRASTKSRLMTSSRPASTPSRKDLSRITGIPQV